MLTLPLKANEALTPRWDPYQKLLSRLYESLFLQKSLGQTRGPPEPEPRDRDVDEARRRNFLRNLAFICDFRKGGQTCCAIAVEDAETSYNFWIASNGHIPQIRDFLKTTLSGLAARTSGRAQGENVLSQETFSKNCMDFARPRINQTKVLFSNAMEVCIEQLRTSQPRENDFIIWLESIQMYEDWVASCKSAYRAVKSDHMMSILSEKKRWEEWQTRFGGDRGPFTNLRHHLGRLAHRVKACKEIFEDAEHLGFMIESCNICFVDRLSGVPRPVPDSHTTLDGIINRMFRQNDPGKEIVKRNLVTMDRHTGILQEYMDQFTRINPTVHAEIQVLEYFHTNGLRFVSDDPFVACSKPACICCKLYFEHHPARFVIPSCHQNIWPNWSPPYIENYRKGDFKSDQQKVLMNGIIQAINKNAIRQIMSLGPSYVRHPDSQTGLTNVSTTFGKNFSTSYKTHTLSSSTGYIGLPSLDRGSPIEPLSTALSATSGLAYEHSLPLHVDSELGGRSELEFDNDDSSDDDEGSGGVFLSGH